MALVFFFFSRFSFLFFVSQYYIERIVHNGSLTLHGSNWRRVLFSCLLIAGKVFHDEAPWNADMSDSFPWITLTDVNNTELELLKLLDFSVSYNQKQLVLSLSSIFFLVLSFCPFHLLSPRYVSDYLRCREISQREFETFPSEILTADQMSTLDQHTRLREQVLLSGKYATKSESFITVKSTAGRAVISSAG